MHKLTERRLSRKQVYAGVVVNIEHWRMSLPDGRDALREVIMHPGAAAVVPVDADGQVVLVEQYRAPMERVTLELPAGKLDAPGEEMLTCAQRELEEETGLRARSWRPLTVLATTPGICDERIGIFLATDLEPGQTHWDEDEFLGVVRMPLKSAVDRVMAGEISDSKTIAGLLMAWQLLGKD